MSRGSDVRGRLQRAGTDLVEARAAIDRSIVPRRERHDGLTPAGPADRGVEFARALVVPRALGGGAARRASLRVVDQTLAGEEGLLAGGEDELFPAVAAGQTTILVHALQTLLTLGRRDGPEADVHGTGVGSAGQIGGLRARCPVRAEPGS